jgi:endonuclease/exonuclease/phosphatase (EEP) superfamily protein YafD
MECIDLFINTGGSSIRLITIYRPPQSKKNRATPSTFLQEFSSLLEIVSLTPGYLLLNGDFNFHMELPNDAHASTFRELLQSAGLRYHVTKTTHRSGHTLDLIIDRRESKIMSNVYTVTDLPSDHNSVLCSIALERSKVLKTQEH